MSWSLGNMRGVALCVPHIPTFPRRAYSHLSLLSITGAASGIGKEAARVSVLFFSQSLC